MSLPSRRIIKYLTLKIWSHRLFCWSTWRALLVIIANTFLNVVMSTIIENIAWLLLIQTSFIYLSQATPDKEQVSELLNYTRLIPEIFNHTSQLTDLWAQVKNMSEKLNAVQEKLENCSFGGGTGHGTLQTTTLIPTTSPMPITTPTTTPTPTEPG